MKLIKIIWLIVKKIPGILYRVTIKLYKLVVKYLKMSVRMLAFSFIIVFMCWKIWDHNLTKMKEIPMVEPSKELQEIFENVSRVTEVSNRIPPFGMWASMESLLVVNAFTTGKGIYFSYLADAALTSDEKAMVIGHEMAHVILHHTDNEFQTFINHYSSEDELMADNVGSTWADKAGYDVCKGREVFMKFYLWGGNSLNADHPPNTLRYENLAHYCKQEKK